MPRTARIKSNTAIYHVMMRSISNFNLFKDKKDKDKYLKLLKKYKEFILSSCMPFVLWILTHTY
jgi:hypothetical protein